MVKRHVHFHASILLSSVVPSMKTANSSNKTVVRHMLLSHIYSKCPCSLLQTCLPPKYPSTPNNPCPYFKIFYQIFCGCTTNHQKQKSVKGHFFCHSSCKKSVWTHIFNQKDALQNWHTMTLRGLHFVYICSSRSCQRLQYTFSKSNTLCVQLLLMPIRHFLNSCCLIGACFLGFFHSSSSLVLCSHLSLTVYSNPPHLKMTNFRKASNAKSKFIGLKTFLTSQDRPYISAPKMA